MNLQKTWQQQGSALFIRDITNHVPKIPKGIYTLNVTEQNEMYLNNVGNEFQFDFKVYGLEEDFIRRVLYTYNNTTSNLGVLLQGVKGTGKSVTAEIMANKSGNPIILINRNYGNRINDYINSIPQDLTILIDEYEKVFEGGVTSEGEMDGDATLLSLMDGTYKTQYRRMFLLTTNELRVNQNMINRPGRIRYLKEFKDLNEEQILEIVDDLLMHPEYRMDIVTFLKPMEIITVDIVKAVIGEVNLFNEPPAVCCEHLNIEIKDDIYEVYQIRSNGNRTLLDGEVRERYGDNFIAECRKGKRSRISLENCYLEFRSFNEDDTLNVVNLHGDLDEEFPVSFVKVASHHSSFKSFIF